MRQKRTCRKRHGGIWQTPGCPFRADGRRRVLSRCYSLLIGLLLVFRRVVFFHAGKYRPVEYALSAARHSVFWVFPPFFRQKMGDFDQKKERCKRARASTVKLHQSLSAFEGVAV